MEPAVGWPQTDVVGRPAIIEPRPASLDGTELLARLFRILGDRTRLRILQLLLEEGELHQAEVVRRLGATQARVSEHLACLAWCGLVCSRTEGRRRLYRVEEREVRTLLRLAQAFLDGNRAQIASCLRMDHDTT